MRRSEHVYRSISSISGQLIFLQGVVSARIGEVVTVTAPHGLKMDAEVLEIEGENVLIEVFGETRGLDIGRTSVAFGDTVRLVPLSSDMIGRIFNGSLSPADDMPMFIPEQWRPITGAPMNPAARARPEEFIETGYSVIDGLNTLVKGQKLPVFSCAGLPSKELVSGILKNSRLSKGEGDFVVVFAALGLTFHEYSYYMKVLGEMKTGFVAVINSAEEPVMERLLAPRFALTIAEYLAFEKEMDVLVIITDMTNYCDALREISTAREELPGRRGYPGYMYSDLASLFERAGRLKGQKGSVTMLPVVTMPEDDITHPIPDLTGYITEGQIVLSRELHRLNVFPPVDVLPSLSRLMQKGIGKDRTREDHRKISNNLFKYYARGRDMRRLEAIVGRDGMPEKDIRMLDFADLFEREFVGQASGRRGIGETLDIGIGLMKRFSLEVT
ncbi:MAG: V-type ATP synthase subunit B [Nitrospirae bacterium]|nr:MAG: V-type ATP synthase subunit B [Nitrospirota bacterium]